jgi:hypothetical protein
MQGLINKLVAIDALKNAKKISSIKECIKGRFKVNLCFRIPPLDIFSTNAVVGPLKKLLV